MTTTISFQNVSGSSNNTAFFFSGQGADPLRVVQNGWYANGPGVIYGVVTNIVTEGTGLANSPVNNSSAITISSQNFQSGQFYSFTNIPPPPCFKSDTKILCLKNHKDIYVPIQDIKRGDLVKTFNNSYFPVELIGRSKIYNSGDNQRITERLYKCSTKNYKDLTEDLVITGAHAILVDNLTEKQRNKIINLFGQVYSTNSKYRLMAVVDEKTTPYAENGYFDIYHLALQNDKYTENYGIYANGLVVESCSIRYLKEKSNMTLL